MWYYNYNIHTPQYNINAFCNLFAAGPDSFISLGVLANCIASWSKRLLDSDKKQGEVKVRK